ncbi:MAG: DMT family transporter [bacterium]
MARTRTGFALAGLSAVTFGSSGPFAAALIRAGWTPSGAVTVRIGLAAVILTPFALRQLRGRWSMIHRSLRSVLAFGVAAVAIPQLCYFNAVERVPVAVALLLEYSGTVLVVGWMWARHGHRPGRLTAGGAAAALIGLVLVLNLTGVSGLDPVGVAWGLGAAVGLAAYFVLSSATADPLPPLVMAWAGLVAGAAGLSLLGAARAIAVRTSSADVELAGQRLSWVVPVIGLSLVAAVIAYVSGIAATRLLGARLASFVGLTEVLAAVAFAWVLLAQVPTGVQFAGGALVLAGVALVRAGEWRTAPQPGELAGQPAGP